MLRGAFGSIWLSRNRRQRFAHGFAVLAKLLRVVIDLPRRFAGVCEG
jgi:hypothetical protein